MTRLLAVLSAVILIAALPAGASAARSTRETLSAVSVFCTQGFLTAVSGGGLAFFSASSNTIVTLEFWATDDQSGPPDLVYEFGQPVDITRLPNALSGSIPLVDSDGSPAGTATFAATLVAFGEPEDFVIRFRQGNHWNNSTFSFQPMDPTGTLMVSDSVFSLDDCGGSELTLTTFDTNPNSFVDRQVFTSTVCSLTNAAGDTGLLFANLGDTRFVDVEVFPADGTPPIGGFGTGTLTRGVLDATLSTFDVDTGEPTDHGGSIHLEIVASVAVDYEVTVATQRLTSRIDMLDLEGALTIGSHSFDLGACVGFDEQRMIFASFPAGPTPGGLVPANDVPGGAELLVIGARDVVATKGASLEPEASYECDPGVPIGHTVWYSVLGTGAPVTIDTAGSDFDTILAVYTADGAGGFEPVPGACVDDVSLEPVGRTLQATVSWDALAGTTYFVQIGGLQQSFPYGNLRVAVR